MSQNSQEVNKESQAKTDPKRFYQVNRTKNKENIGPLKVAGGELASSGENIKILNKYSLTVFTRENMQDMPDSEQMFRADENEKLTKQ